MRQRKIHAVNPIRSLLVAFILFATVLLRFTNVASANAGRIQDSGATQPSNDAGSRSIFWGLGGYARLGRWAPVTIAFSSATNAEEIATLRITCPDGDDIPCTYEMKPVRSENDPRVIQGYFRIGRTRGELRVQGHRTDGTLAFEEVISAGSRLQVVPATSRVVYYAGEAGESLPEAIVNSDRYSAFPDYLIGALTANEYPLSTKALGCVDVIVINGRDPERFNEIRGQCLNALRDWTQCGGHAVTLLSPGAIPAIEAGVLKDWCEFESVVAKELQSTARVESFVNASTPLLVGADQTMSVVDATIGKSTPVISQDGLPLVQTVPVGFGKLTVVAFPLDVAPAVDWQSTPALLKKLLYGAKSGVEQSLDSLTAQSTRIGYRDLTGQLRVPLEQFSSVGFIPFTAIALIIVLFLLLVGPGDYFMLKSMGRRMHWTWLTFPLLAIAFSGLAYWLYHLAKPSVRQFNQLEIVDIDLASKRIQSHSWASFYSPQSAQSDFGILPVQPMVGAGEQRELSWMGQPGAGLGGMQTTTPVLTIVNGYEQLIDADDVSLKAFPSAVASARTMYGRWEGSIDLSMVSRLKVQRGIDRIDGSIVNGFEFPLIRPRIYYQNSVYYIDRDLGPGESLDLFSEASELTAKTFMTRGSNSPRNDGVQMAPWNQSDTNMFRIGEVMMFYDLSGGPSYTGLSHRYLNQVEFSDTLFPNQAILVAGIPERFSEVVVDGNRVSDEYSQSATLIRILLPVEIPFD
ncbi:MAG: hypothetical protein R3C03_05290 [Pirellulaceae bacterium]